MKRLKPYTCLLAVILFMTGCQNHSAVHSKQESGPTNAMGRQVEEYLDGATMKAPERGRLKALIVPESSTPDAQAVAADAYKALEGLRFDTVVLVGQAHGTKFEGASIYKGEDIETPFGPVPVDKVLAGRLIDPASGVVSNPDLDRDIYVDPVHLAFLRRALGDCKVVPVLIGQPGQKTFERLTAALATEATKRKTSVLLVALSDLSTGNEGTEKDARTIESLKGLDPAGTQRLLRSGEAALTGEHAVLVVTEAALWAGVDVAEVFHYDHEKTANGPMAGHAAMGFYDVPLDDAERVDLLTLAWRTVEAAAMGREYDPPRVEDPRLVAFGAAFVTIEKNRRLRGGMGQVQATGPLYRSVITSARAAAMEDDRFPPVNVRDLDALSYEVSVLTPLVPVLDVRHDIELGTHGLYMRMDGHSGMLLPQVPVEQRWDLDEYLRQISLRAGLPPDAWRDKDARLWSFTTEIVR